MTQEFYLTQGPQIYTKIYLTLTPLHVFISSKSICIFKLIALNLSLYPAYNMLCWYTCHRVHVDGTAKLNNHRYYVLISQ